MCGFTHKSIHPDSRVRCIARVRYNDDVVCEYKFIYELDANGNTNIKIADTKCPPVNVAAYSILGIILATFLLGLLIMMIVKVNIFYADKREFAKFEAERKAETSYVYSSPIYKSPVSIFRNPLNERDSINTFELQ
jgi:Integrin beta cytoplasmic domain